MKFPASGLRGLALREAAPDLMRTISLVRAALSAKIDAARTPGEPESWFELEAVYEDRAVICMDGRHWSYPYTVDAGVVTIGDAQEVMETFVPLKEGAPMAASLRLVEAADGQPEGMVWEATIIEAGVSENDVFYPDSVLREAVSRFDGVRICIKSDLDHVKGVGRDLRQVVGWGENPRFIEGASPDTGRIVAELQLPGLAENTRSLLVAAVKAGRQQIAGLSIDARGRGRMGMREGKKVREAMSIDKIDSVDLIVEPGAGGRLIRLVEAAPSLNHGDSDMNLRDKMLRYIEAKAPTRYAKINPDTISDDDLEVAYREAVAGGAGAAAGAGGQAADLEAVEQRLRMIEARATARATIAASTLPEPAKDRLQRDFATRERFVEADVTAAIESERKYLARFVESGRVNIGDFDSIQVEDRSVRMGQMLDAFFDPTHKDHRDVQSFKECYIEMTGDRRVTGRLADCDTGRMRESFGASFREATMDSGTFAVALGDAITRRMLADYNNQSNYDVWRDLAAVVPLSDFRTQHRTRWGGFGDLPVVAEKGDYIDLGEPDDEEATYKAGKRGGLAKVTLEMTRNDDVSIIRQIPTKLSRAAKRTLGKFVMDFVRVNPVIYDGKAMFHVDHANLGANALSAAGWSATRNAMMKVTEQGSNDRVGISPKFLWVPSDLEETAYNLFKNRGQNNDQSFIQTTAPSIRPVWYWDDVSDWAASADKMDIQSVEIGFLDGREDPELLIQDNPTVGSLFSNDVLTYKVRHIYGGAIVDYRGVFKNVVP